MAPDTDIAKKDHLWMGTSYAALIGHPITEPVVPCSSGT